MPCRPWRRVPDFLTIPARFNGPPGSANGGYTCGLVAGMLEAEVAEVSLRAPPPLEHPLEIVRAGRQLELRDGETLVATAAPAELELESLAAVSLADARAASTAGREEWRANHPFPTCVVCGPDRDAPDGMRVFPGSLGNGRYAAEWTPDESLGNGRGRVRSECVWAALDCPTSAPVANFGEGPPVVLARLSARIDHPVLVGEPHAIVSWPLEVDGRKRHAAAGLFDSEGLLLSASRALWIELKPRSG
jgi:hypothetical protein